MSELSLSTSEAALLARLETVIEDGIAIFVKVGEALLTIREARLYRETHNTFEDYCLQRWRISKTHANRLVQASKVMEVVTPTGVTPATERQARELVPLLADPDALRETWAAVVESHPEPTAANVREGVKSRRRSIGGRVHADRQYIADTPMKRAKASVQKRRVYDLLSSGRVLADVVEDLDVQMVASACEPGEVAAMIRSAKEGARAYRRLAVRLEETAP